jgi:hypothetical protein
MNMYLCVARTWPVPLPTLINDEPGGGGREVKVSKD